MRKIIRILVAALCMLALTAAIPFSAFADGKPGAADIAATGDDRIILLPAEDAPCRGYAEIMAQVFEDAGAEVTCE